MDVLIAHADAFVVIEIDAVVGEQHLEYIIALVTRPGDRAENTNSLGLMAERVKHAEGHRRLAGMPLDGRDVNGAGHSPSLGFVAQRNLLASLTRQNVRDGLFSEASRQNVRDANTGRHHDRSECDPAENVTA